MGSAPRTLRPAVPSLQYSLSTVADLARLVASVSRPKWSEKVEKHRESADFLHFPRLEAMTQQAS